MNSRRHSRKGAEKTAHPMLVHGAGIATIVAACTSASNALTLSLIMLALCSAMALIYIFERSEYIQPMLSVLYFAPAAIIACVFSIIAASVSVRTASDIGMYLPLTAVDALVLSRIQPDSPFVQPSESLPNAIRLWWLYATMALPTGILREILGSGTLFGFRLFFNPAVGGMKLPFAGFIMLGFGLALYNRLTEKK
ncbi:MAG: hypothetical protein IIZ08_08985 [Clostridia bacterium]|jgi:electron transport complex protein RnfE|nr:hypothetical protein [Clostridia bacterium]